jgi:hypothetical protein
MKLGNNIEIKMALDASMGKTSVHYNGYMVGGIRSVKLDVHAGAFGEEISKFIIAMWDPRELYTDEYTLHLQQEFIEEARRAGAEVMLYSVLDMSEDDLSPREDSDSTPATESIARLAIACVTIAGLASLLGSNNKKQKVQKKQKPAMKLSEHQHQATVKNR